MAASRREGDTANAKQPGAGAVGTGKTLTASGAVNDGNGGNNYTVIFIADASGAITARTLVTALPATLQGLRRHHQRASHITSGTLAAGDTANFTETYDNPSPARADACVASTTATAATTIP